MAQSNISMSNKTGYSMFWNSMWDNKNSYTRGFKEDIFLKSFFKFAFNDNISVSTINFKNNKKYIQNNYSQFLEYNNKNLIKYFISINKFNSYSSKVWVLKYQKWLIIYNFIFINNFSINGVLNFKYKSNNVYNSNFFYLYKNYIKSEKSNRLLYNAKKISRKILNF